MRTRIIIITLGSLLALSLLVSACRAILQAEPGESDRETELENIVRQQQERIAALEATITAQATAIAAQRPTSTPTPQPTARPGPTEIPIPTLGPRRPVEKVSKLGIGVYSRGGGHLIDSLLRAEPGVILLMEPDIDFAKEVRRWFPKAFIIGRRFFLSQPLDNPQQRGEEAADYVAAKAVPLQGAVDAWVSYNEVVRPGDIESYKAYNIFQVAFARKLQNTYGIAAVAANDSIGVVQPEDYAQYFAEAISESRYFGVHAYPPAGAKTLDQEATWFVLRYRLIHQALENAGIKHGPIVLTEVGLGKGWRNIVSEREMTEEFFWLAREVEKDPYVRGFAIFGLFADEEWEGFDIAGTSVPDRLRAYEPKA